MSSHTILADYSYFLLATITNGSAPSEAILRAVRMAEGLPGIPSVRELGR